MIKHKTWHADTIEKLERQMAAEQRRINRAYWAFTREASAKPPSLVVPDAYERREKLRKQIAQLKRQSRVC